MRLEGQGNLRTMDPLAKGVIDDTSSVRITTKMGSWEIRELPSGAIEFNARYLGDFYSCGSSGLIVRPQGGRTVILEMRN